MSCKRRNQYDVTNQVRVSHPGDVSRAVQRLLKPIFPESDLSVLDDAFKTFAQLYSGQLEGYVGCDTWYHDAQHSLDCTLAFARLLDGHERSVGDEQRLGARRGVLGVIIALFHDAGYIRRSDDQARNGAEFTLNHVTRSGAFLSSILPGLGFADEVDLTQQLVHFTGYEVALDKIRVSDPKDRLLGFMVGTADILAQTSDRCYLEKCRDYLFREFEICGMAGKGTGVQTLYPDAPTLLRNTPEFNRSMWSERLDGYFGSVHRFMKAHFGGRDPYREQINEHLTRVARIAKRGKFHELSRRPVAINAIALRRLLASDRTRLEAA